jgi:hypothetical protein
MRRSHSGRTHERLVPAVVLYARPPLVEIELRSGVFRNLVRLILAKSPIPVPTLNILGSDRLIAAMTRKSPALGAAPAGFTARPGTLPVRSLVTVRHVSIAELQANPSAQGITTELTAGWEGCGRSI